MAGLPVTASFRSAKTLTFLADLRHDRIVAPRVLDGPVNSESFQAWVAHMLMPTLKPGNVVVLDNPGNLKLRAVGKAIRAVACNCCSGHSLKAGSLL